MSLLKGKDRREPCADWLFVTAEAKVPKKLCESGLAHKGGSQAQADVSLGENESHLLDEAHGVFAKGLVPGSGHVGGQHSWGDIPPPLLFSPLNLFTPDTHLMNF